MTTEHPADYPPARVHVVSSDVPLGGGRKKRCAFTTSYLLVPGDCECILPAAVGACELKITFTNVSATGAPSVFIAGTKGGALASTAESGSGLMFVAGNTGQTPEHTLFGPGPLYAASPSTNSFNIIIGLSYRWDE